MGRGLDGIRRLVRGIIAVLILAATAFTAAATPSSAQADETKGNDGNLKTLRIGFPSSGSNWAGGALGVAVAKGYLDEYLKPLGYKAQTTGFVGAAPALHEALASGDLDYVNYAGFAGILGKSKGVDTTLLGVTAYNSGWRLVASTASGIRKLSDLKGKKIAYQRGAAPQMYMIKVLKEAGLKFSDVEAVNASLPDGLSTLASNGVDAAVTNAGQEQQLVNEGKARVLHIGKDADRKTYYEPTVLVANRTFNKKHPDVSAAILQAMLKAKDDIVADHEAYIKLSSQKSGNPLNVLRATEVDDAKTGYPMSLSSSLIDSMKSVQQFELDNSLISRSIDIVDWTDPKPLRTAIAEYRQQTLGESKTKARAAADKAVSGVVQAASASAEASKSRNGRIFVTVVLPILVYVLASLLIVLGRRRVIRKIDALERHEEKAIAHRDETESDPSARKDSEASDDSASYRGALLNLRKILTALFALILPVGILVAWHTVSAAQLVSSLIMPSISSVGKTIVAELAGPNGTFVGDVAISVSRILKGYALALVFGLLFGVLMGMSLNVHRFFMLTFKAFRQIPMMAWVPLLVMWFGIGEGSKVAVIFLAAFFPILVNTIDGISRTDPHLVEVGRMYQFSRWRMFREVYLPSALPSIFVGLKLALGISWMAVVGAEMIAASSGIGFRINDARSLMDYSIVFAGMIVIAVAGVIMDAVLSLIAHISTPWTRK